MQNKFVTAGATVFLLGAAALLSLARAEEAVVASSSAPGPIYRASDLENMAVRNAANESLGKVEEVVIDLKHGNIRYVVLSFGGFLGVGDKFFAVPFKALRMQSDDGGKKWHMVLDVDKDRLKDAPGFPKDNWPDFANAAWGRSDTFYIVPAAKPDAKTSVPQKK